VINSNCLDSSFIHSLVHPSRKYLPSTYSMPGMVPGPGIAAANLTVLGVEDAAKDKQKSHSYRVDIPMGEVDNKH